MRTSFFAMIAGNIGSQASTLHNYGETQDLVQEHHHCELHNVKLSLDSIWTLMYSESGAMKWINTINKNKYFPNSIVRTDKC